MCELILKKAVELWYWKRFLRVPWTARRSNQSILKRAVLGIHWKVWYWSQNSNTLATWCEELTQWKRPWCWERLKAEEKDSKGWDGWMASLTHWRWIWVNFGSWWWTVRPGVLSPWGLKELDTIERLNLTEVQVSQLCLTLCDLMEYTVHGILWARILEWVAVRFLRGSSQPRDRIQVSSIAGRFFTSWATREVQEYWSRYSNWGLLYCRWILYQLRY